MELAKELFNEVLHDRVCCSDSTPTDRDTKMGAIMTTVNRFLADGASISVHVLMGHDNCKAAEKELCGAAQKLEVWTFRIQRDRPQEMAGQSPMLPLFLKQAIRSQLHFSPFRSWLSARKDSKVPDGLCPLLRIATSSHFATLASSSDQVHSHQFPPCQIDPSLPVPNSANPSTRRIMHNGAAGPFWLHVQVQWLKKECFLSKAPMCPELKMEHDDHWVSPVSREAAEGYPDVGRCCSQTSARNDVDEEKEGEDGDEDSEEEEDSDDSSSLCSNPKTPLMSRRKAELEKEEQSTGRRTVLSRRNSRTTEVTDGILESETKNEEKEVAEEMRAKTPAEVMVKVPESKRIPVVATTSDVQQPPPLMATTPRFHPRTRLPISSSPIPPLFRRQLKETTSSSYATRNNAIFANDFAGERTKLEPNVRPKQMISMNSDATKLHIESVGCNANKWGCRAPDRLVCNFEESMLSGRIVPNSVVDGFRLQLTVIGRGSPSPASKHLTLPIRTYFFNDLTDVADQMLGARTPSPLHLARCELESTGVLIPRHCVLQVVLFNSYGSVVKLFMVDVDVRDMPSNSRTFIRQRTFSGGDSVETGTSETGNVERPKSLDDRHKMGNVNDKNLTPPNGKSSSSSSLRFLIHLRLASDGLGRIYLHGDIRILFSNKANDLEGLESLIDKTRTGTAITTGACAVSGTLRSVAQMPQMPKYSPIK